MSRQRRHRREKRSEFSFVLDLLVAPIVTLLLPYKTTRRLEEREKGEERERAKRERVLIIHCLLSSSLSPSFESRARLELNALSSFDLVAAITAGNSR